MPCLDMPEFGGPGKADKLCVLKRCIKPTGGKRVKYAAARLAAEQEASNTRTRTNEPTAAPSDDESLSSVDSFADELSDMEYDEDKTHDIIALLQSSRYTTTGNNPAEVSNTQSEEDSDCEDDALLPPPPAARYF